MCVRAGACVCPGECSCACAYVHVALLIQHATHMRHIVISFVSSLAPPYFSTLSHKGHDFLKNVIDHKICVLIFSTNLYKIFFILRIIQRDIFTNVETPLSKVPVIFIGF
jgi:hypothetical protein